MWFLLLKMAVSWAGLSQSSFCITRYTHHARPLSVMWLGAIITYTLFVAVGQNGVETTTKAKHSNHGVRLYADNVITALKVLVQGWVKNRYKEACYERARALHRDANLAMQQINLFFKGPVMSMQYGRQFGPQSVRDCTDTLLPKMGTGAPLFERENKTATKNFARARPPKLHAGCSLPFLPFLFHL